MFREKKDEVERLKEKLGSFVLSAKRWSERGVKVKETRHERMSAADVLRFPGVNLESVNQAMSLPNEESGPTVMDLGDYKDDVKKHVETEMMYSRTRGIKVLQSEEYKTDITGLQLEETKDLISNEDFEILRDARPATLHGAMRAGMKPAALLILYHLQKQRTKTVSQIT